jgi:hypothetical protein
MRIFLEVVSVTFLCPQLVFREEIYAEAQQIKDAEGKQQKCMNGYLVNASTIDLCNLPSLC